MAVEQFPVEVKNHVCSFTCGLLMLERSKIGFALKSGRVFRTKKRGKVRHGPKLSHFYF